MNAQEIIETITYTRITALLDEARNAGDAEQAQICRDALDGDSAAKAECARVIAYAEDRKANG